MICVSRATAAIWCVSVQLQQLYGVCQYSYSSYTVCVSTATTAIRSVSVQLQQLYGLCQYSYNSYTVCVSTATTAIRSVSVQLQQLYGLWYCPVEQPCKGARTLSMAYGASMQMSATLAALASECLDLYSLMMLFFSEARRWGFSPVSSPPSSTNGFSQ